MILAIEPLLWTFLLISGFVALQARDMLVATVVMGVFSFWTCVLYNSLGAPDVGFTEAVVGAGVSGFFFIATLFQTVRKAGD